MTDNLLKLVNEFANRNNFPDDEWYARGLVPSSSEKIAALNESIKDVAQGILESFSKTGNQRFLQQKLENLHLQEFDTEEKDFLFDKLRLLFEKMGLMEVFDKWLSAELKPFKRDFDQIKVTKQRCLGCSSKLITWILDFDPQFTYPDWELGKCNDCGKLNLIQIENARSFQPKTFTLIKSFKRSEFSKEAVLNELLKLEKK